MNPISLVRDDFFVVGGALQQSAPCYVARRADQDLYDGLSRGEFCYVLTPRQMGKSSLMVQTAFRLRDAGVTIVALDLTAIGQNLDAEQWYGGLLASLGEQLDLDDELDEFWCSNDRFGPLQRWMAAIRQIVIPRFSKLVIFVDEIDVVSSLPFSTDEFFAAIRSCYNQRADDPLLNGLTFCLLGVATPSDLIRDTRMTPFNIGRRIELHDFTTDEAAPLAAGLAGEGRAAPELLARIMFWTRGHPYLTQRLCQAVAGDPQIRSRADVDRICDENFLSQAARDQDSNLIFVRDRILRSDDDLAGLLGQYARVLGRRRVAYDDRSPLHSILRLSGIARVEAGRLRVRNEIYQHVFNQEWIKVSMPDAEVRRQRAAFRRGLMGASAVAAVFIAILTVSGLLLRSSEKQRLRSEYLEEALQVETAALKIEEQLRADAEEARENERKLRVTAVSAREAEKKLRKTAEKLRGEAEQAQETEKELRKNEEKLTAEAVEARRTVEVALAAATIAQSKERAQALLADEARKEAERALAYAEQQEIIRSQLFAKLIISLGEHASEGVLNYTTALRKEGKPAEALAAFSEFCGLALSEEGFLTQDLLRLFAPDGGQFDIGSKTTNSRITVPPTSLFKNVVEPAIELGEERLQINPDDEKIKALLAKIHTSRARLLKQYPTEQWPSRVSAKKMVFDSYDWAVRLDPGQSEHYIGRAVARFRLADRDLEKVRNDLDAAIRLFPNPPERPLAGDSVTEPHRSLAQLLSTKAIVTEYLAEQSSQKAREKYLKDAEQTHRRASEWDPKNPNYPLGLARTLRKRATASSPRSRSAELNRAKQLLDTAIGLNAQSAPAYDELGQLYLLQGKAVAARSAFTKAIELCRRTERKRNLYHYYCNQAYAYTRDPATVANYRQALAAAESALRLEPKDASNGHFYRGLALSQLKKTTEALAEFSLVLRKNPTHIEALLVQCEIIFVLEAPTPEQVNRARQDVRQVIGDSRLTDRQQAKAYYVYSLAFLQHYLNSNTESSLIECQKLLLQAATVAPVHLISAKKVFDHAASRTWTDSKLREESKKLQEKLTAIKASAAGGDAD